MPRAFRGVLLAVAGVLLLAASLVAQGNTGNVYGNVIDEQGGKIPGGTATLIGPSAPTTTSVDAQGLFRFLKVPPGKYAVTVVMPGRVPGPVATGVGAHCPSELPSVCVADGA